MKELDASLLVLPSKPYWSPHLTGLLRFDTFVINFMDRHPYALIETLFDYRPDEWYTARSP